MPAADPRLPAEFGRAMAALGPFAPAPHLAVAVSGGADSLALCLLADAWAKAEGGRITALVVDHRLRGGSTAEAVQVGDWLDRRGIAHQRLVWDVAKPVTGIQAAAREARYRLLADWCRAAGVGHLLVGHQAADQAETVLMRIWRASGIIGLAGIRPCVELADVRLVRPLLGVPPERLRRYLEAEGQPWIEDASNRDPAFTRVRLRQASASLAAAGIDRAALLELARLAGIAREATEEATATLLAQSVILHSAGFAWVETAAWRRAAQFIAIRALARLLGIIGGRRWEPEDRRVARLLSALLGEGHGDGAAATLAGCRLQQIGGRLRVWREARGLPTPRPLVAGGRLVWDRRFALDITMEDEAPPGLVLEALGASRARAIAAAPPAASADVPKVVWPTLPCLVDAAGLLCVPHLGYWRADGAGGLRVVTQLQQSLGGRASFLV
jgi:tRNA(Ile)-lysidine synthase